MSKNHLGIIFKYKQSLAKNFVFDPKVTKSVVGYFFVHGLLGDLKSFMVDVLGHAESIATFFMKNFLGLKNRIFSSGV